MWGNIFPPALREEAFYASLLFSQNGQEEHYVGHRTGFVPGGRGGLRQDHRTCIAEGTTWINHHPARDVQEPGRVVEGGEEDHRRFEGAGLQFQDRVRTLSGRRVKQELLFP